MSTDEDNTKGEGAPNENADTNPQAEIPREWMQPSEVQDEKTRVSAPNPPDAGKAKTERVSTDPLGAQQELDPSFSYARHREEKTRNLGPLLLVIAVTTAVAAYGIGILAVRVAQKSAQDTVELVPVVVAQKDLKEGTVIDDDSVALHRIPKDLVTSSVVLPSQTGELYGKRLGLIALRGDPIRWEQLQGSEKNRKLSPYIRPGARAYSISVEQKSGLGGLLHYYDEVDVVVLMMNPRDPGAQVAYTLTQGVPVLAAGGQAQSTSLMVGDSKEYFEVSLLLLPEEIEALALAQHAGKIRLILRRPSEPISSRQEEFVTFDTIFSGKRQSTLVEPPKPKAPSIQIIRPTRRIRR